MEEKKEEKEGTTGVRKTEEAYKGPWEVGLRLDPDFPMDWQLRW